MSETVALGGRDFLVRAFGANDRAALERFVGEMPLADMLFIDRDLRHPKVIEAWLAAVDAGEVTSLVALDGERIVATTANVRDSLSWSPHVCEVRLLVLPEVRGNGLGRLLLERSVAQALEAGSQKLFARMTPDHADAVALFEEHGFHGEALLAAHVRDGDGALHDVAILALDPAEAAGRRAAYA